MARPRIGSVVQKRGRYYARITYIGTDGKRHAKWRAAKNRTHARNLIPEMYAALTDSPEVALPRPERRRGFIYAARMEVPGIADCPIKIGFSVDVEGRMKTFEIGSPYPFTVLGYWETANADQEEKEIHASLKGSRLRGEWFAPSETLLSVVTERTNSYRKQLRKRETDLAELVRQT